MKTFQSCARVLLAATLSLGALAANAAQDNLLAPIPAGLRSILDSALDAGQPLVGIAMLDRVPASEDVSALQAHGLFVQPLHHLPMALVKGRPQQLLEAWQQGAARDIYPDRRLSWDSDKSTAAMHADQTRALGYIGSGVGIAIVDSGIDATHPVLMQRVVHNTRVYSPEYADILGLSEFGVPVPHSPALVISFDALPYDNTDTIGHGTHVSSIAAGDGTGDPVLIGVAPGANLVGYSTGEILFIITALAAYDDILAVKDQYNIRVINNSWGSAFALFDPNAPINVATRVMHDLGITVVFSAGNAADEMTTGPNSHAPWVISVCSGKTDRTKSGFSSSGLMFDNTGAQALDADGHVHFEGDGLGITRPDVCAPGDGIVGAGTPTGVTATPGTPPGGRHTLSGTSMAAPHVAGLAAVLLQANPALTPDQIRQVLEVTTEKMDDETEFWQTGYGWVNAKAAVDLVITKDFTPAKLDQMEADVTARFLAARAFKVLASDHWIFAVVGGSVEGAQSKTFTFDVKPETQSIRSSVAFPGDLGAADINLVFEWSLTLKDPDGNTVAASSSLSGSAGVYGMQYDSPEGKPLKAGKWSITAAGVLSLTQPALLYGNQISVSTTQLAVQKAAAPGKSIAAGAGRFGGALGFAVLLPLLGLAALRRRRLR